MKTHTIPVLLALAAASVVSASAQVLFTGTQYTQNFNALPLNSAAGAISVTINNNSTLLGWYSSVGTGSNAARASNGSSTASGMLYSWGSANDTDRAFGSFFGGTGGFTGGTAYFGLQIKNNGLDTYDSASLGYTVEQWRNNVNATIWNFEYLVTVSTGDQLTASGYSTISGGAVTAPQTGSSGGLNGNLVANQVSRSISINTLDWQPNEFLWIRVSNVAGDNSSGLGLDAFSLSAIAIPEPASASALAGLLALGCVALRRRRSA